MPDPSEPVDPGPAEEPGVGEPIDDDALEAFLAEAGADLADPPLTAVEGLSVEGLLEDLEALATARDDLQDRLLRAQAEFENSRRRVQRDAEQRAEAAAARLAEELLPVLDACDGALAHGEAAVEPVFAALLQILEKNGLERIDPLGEPFDPTRHEAVMHEAAETHEAEPAVIDVLRIGYAWKGRVVRAAMVKVRG